VLLQRRTRAAPADIVRPKISVPIRTLLFLYTVVSLADRWHEAASRTVSVVVKSEAPSLPVYWSVLLHELRFCIASGGQKSACCPSDPSEQGCRRGSWCDENSRLAAAITAPIAAPCWLERSTTTCFCATRCLLGTRLTCGSFAPKQFQPNFAGAQATSSLSKDDSPSVFQNLFLHRQTKTRFRMGDINFV
jgi:hypothetical protein